MESLKGSFLQRYSQKKRDSAQYYYTARSGEIEMSENPILANTAQSQNICFDFRKLQFSGLLGSTYILICRKNFENLLALIENLKLFRKYILAIAT